MANDPQAPMTQPWYRISAKASSYSAEVFIFGDIGENWLAEESITAKSFVKELEPLKGRPLNVRINSYGGSVSDGLAIYNALRRHAANARVTTHNEGVAMSIASLIAMAGDAREMAANALYMVHAPWGVAIGNAVDMRDMADTLDKYAEAMTSAYTRAGTIDADTVKALLADGQDHFYTAEEALAAGFVTSITEDLAIAAQYRTNRFTAAPSPLTTAPQAGHRTHQQEHTMPKTPTGAEPNAAEQPSPQATADITHIQAAAEAKARAEIAARNKEVRALFKPFLARVPEFAALQDECLDDVTLSLDAVSARLLTELGKNVEPLAADPRIDAGESAEDKFKKGVAAALGHRLGIEKDDRANEFRGKALGELAALSLEIKGIRAAGLTRSEIAGRVLAAHTTSDLPYLLADAANKSLQAAWGAFPSVWPQIAAVGSVSDFKTINLVKLGSFSSLETILEGGEYTEGTIGEEREQLRAVTKGKYIQLTRQMIINDDLSGFARLAAALGRAAARTVNADVIGVLTANAALADGDALFHANHANLTGSGTAISVGSIGLARAAMRVQKDASGNDYTNILPRTLLVPVGKEDLARTVVSSQYNTDTTAQLKRNIIQDWGRLDVISDPLLDAASATAWYLIADPLDAPLLEIRFLDGQQTPYIAQEEEFLTDAIRWKVRLDYGVAANDFRAGHKNAGA